MTASTVFALSLLSVALAVPMMREQFAEMIELLISMRMIPTIISTESDFRHLVSNQLVEPPLCPFSNEIYACGPNGRLSALVLTAPTLEPNQSLRLVLSPGLLFYNLTIRNFVGVIQSTSSAVIPLNLIVVDSTLINTPLPICVREGCFFIFPFQPATSLVLRNVTVFHGNSRPFWPQSSAVPDSAAVGPRDCAFENVRLPCPIPPWLAHCFNATDVASVPCTTPAQDASSAFVSVEAPSNCTKRTTACIVTCTPPPAPGFECEFPDPFPLLKGYYPATSGFATIELVAGYVGIAETLISDVKVRSTITKIEVWNWHALNWSVIEFFFPERTGPTAGQVVHKLPAVTTNRIRVTLEQWFPTFDSVVRMDWTLGLFGESIRAGGISQRQCAFAESVSTRSMLDETVADSYCIGRLCQFPCQFADNFTFDRSVVPRFVVIEGGTPWSGAPLEAMPSDDTRVYRYNASLQAIDTLNLTGVIGAKRVRLIGDPVNGEPLPSPKLPSRRGMPGIFVKRRMRSLPSGFAPTTNSSVVQSECGGATVPSGTFSAAVVANVTFVFTDAGDLLRCAMDDGNWVNETGAARLTRITVNSGAPTAVRRLAGVGGRFLIVVSAYSVLHDGTMQRQLVNRVAVSSAVDVLDVTSNAWFNNLLQHDIGRNVSDVDVAVHQNGSFAVAGRESGAPAMVFEWRPYPYKLIECGDNNDCRSCLSNEANDETCRWCGTRCTTAQAVCFTNETSTINVSMCEQLTTKITTVTATTKTATTAATSTPVATTTAGNDSTTSDSSVASLSTSGSVDSITDPLIPLYAVVGVVGGLAIIGAIGALVWKIRQRSDAAEEPVEQRNKENQDDIAMQRYSAFDADTQVAAGANVGGTYDDSSVLTAVR